jgi:hypothetical protein
MALPARDHKVRRASAVAAWLSSLLPRNPRPL